MTAEQSGHGILLLDTLNDLPAVPFNGTVWRVVNGARSPLDGSKGAGRWNLRESEVLYCSLEKDGALSEMNFHISRQNSVFPGLLNSVIHRLNACFEYTLDLSNVALLEKLGVNRSQYTEILYEQTQKIGEAVNSLGFEAMRVPNARHKSVNLIVSHTTAVRSS